MQVFDDLFKTGDHKKFMDKLQKRLTHLNHAVAPSVSQVLGQYMKAGIKGRWRHS